MKKRNLVIAALLMLALIVTGATYAYWAGNVKGSNSNTDGNSVTIGEGHDVETTVTASTQSANTALVPTAHKVGSKTDRVTLTFSVDWKGIGTNGADANGTIATLSAVISNIRIDGQDINNDGLGNVAMFVITPQGNSSITAGTLLSYTIEVVFAVEPKDKVTYDLVAGKNVTFDVTFTVAV